MDEALELFRHILSLTSNPSGFLFFNLGHALATRVFHLESPSTPASETADEAILFLSKASEMFEKDRNSSYSAQISSTLAALNTHQYFEGGKLSHLEEALRLERRAWESVPLSSPQRAQVQRQVAKLHILLAKEGRVAPTDNWLPAELYTKCSKYLSVIPKLPSAYARDKFGACQNWSQLVKSYIQLHGKGIVPASEHLEPYTVGMEIIPHLTTFAQSLGDRHQQLHGVGPFVRDAASIATRQGQHKLAIEWLEQGRAVTWTQLHSLQLPLQILRDAHPELGNRLAVVSHVLKEASSGKTVDVAGMIPGKKNTNFHDLAQERVKLLEQIDTLPEFKGLFKPTSFRDMELPMREHGFAVYLNVSREGCDALVIERASDGSKITPVPLPDFSDRDAKRLQKSLSHSLQRSRLARGETEETPKPKESPMEWDSVGNAIGATAQVIRAHRSGNVTEPPHSDPPLASPEDELELLLVILWLHVVEPILTALDLKVSNSRPTLSSHSYSWSSRSGSA